MWQNDISAHAERLAAILTPVFNACTLIQWTPLELLRTILVPIPKSGSKTEITNYRGIAISNAICKTLDKLITKKLTANIEKFMTHTQYGFRKGYSTTTCILDLTQEIAEQVKWADRVDVAFIDLSKAFDHLAHTSIAKALAAIGMPLPQVKFLMQFINHRQYHVRINGVTAEVPIVPSSGIPQGSCIGPVIFILVCNALPNVLSSSTKIYQYADDTVLLQSINDGNSEDNLQSSISNVGKWAAENGMAVNTNKSVIMKFSKHRPDVLTKYRLNGEDLPQVSSYKYLGVTLDDKLSFALHTRNIKERTCRLAFAAARLCKAIKNRHFIMRLYKAYIDPIICYGATVWAFRNKTTMAAAGEAHRICTRLALNIPLTLLAPHYLSYDSRCAKLSTQTNENRIAYIVMTNTKRITMSIQFSHNAAKILSAMNEPDENRRVQRPFIDPTVKSVYTNTPIQYIMSAIQGLTLSYTDWTAEWSTFKQLLRNKQIT